MSGKWRRGVSQPEWMSRVRPGDILMSRSGPRVVRKVSLRENGQLSAVTLVIKRCSWTGRCYTILGYTDLIYQGFSPTGERYQFRRKIDRDVAHDVAYDNRFRQRLDCCDVEGIS